MKQARESFYNSVNLNADTDFPYLVLNVINGRSYPQTPAFQIMHWHEDLQLIYVLDGSISLKTLAESVALAAGEGLFVNKRVLHRVEKVENSHYKTFRFPDYFLGFYVGCPARQLVESITKNESFTMWRFDTQTAWSREVLATLRKLSDLESNITDRTNFYMYEVLVRLAEIWLMMCQNIRLPVESAPSATNMRMQRFLRYIEQHYAEEITLADLAASANVSKSECLRCFKQSMQTSPYKYLVEYRLLQAAMLLKSSNENIAGIANRVGFQLVSHFSKCFREKTGQTPTQYRRQAGQA